MFRQKGTARQRWGFQLDMDFGTWRKEKGGVPECLYKYIDNLGIMSKKKNPPWKRWVLCLLDNLCGLPSYKQQSDCIRKHERELTFFDGFVIVKFPQGAAPS